MKKLLLTLLFPLIAIGLYAQPNNNPRKIQVSILFDTSGSMSGLLDQAKSRLWNIINEISDLRYDGQVPEIQFALYQYGNSGLPQTENYIQQILDLTDDLDTLSKLLFGLTTNGGDEYCGAVIGRSLDDLNWSADPADLRMIYIAGNESFAQGPVNYKDQCKKAAEKGVCINTIFCGDYQAGIDLEWQAGSSCSNCDYFNIDANKRVAHIETPYDVQINQLNDSLNATYFGYGVRGRDKKEMQVSEDANAAEMSPSVKTERSIAKSKGAVYKNSSWDFIDAVDNGRSISDFEEDELPKEFQGKTITEKIELYKEKKDDRIRYQKKIAELAQEREMFIAEERAKLADNTEDDFGSSVNESIRKKAEEKGYKKVTTP